MRRRLLEGDIHDIDPVELIEFANKWRDLGPAVQEQVETVLAEGPGSEANPNAIDMAYEALLGMNELIDISLSEWLNYADYNDDVF